MTQRLPRWLCAHRDFGLTLLVLTDVEQGKGVRCSSSVLQFAAPNLGLATLYRIADGPERLKQSGCKGATVDGSLPNVRSRSKADIGLNVRFGWKADIGGNVADGGKPT
jgi:hypothetical protein